MRKYLKDLFLALAFILIIYILGVLYWEEFLEWLSRYPVFDSVLAVADKEIKSKSIIGLSILSFAGGLFFVGYPLELVFLAYSSIGYGSLLTALIMLIYTMLAQLANYGMGFFIEKKFLHTFVKSRESDFLEFLKKYDIMFIVVINILPLPADILSVFLGMIKYDFNKSMVYTLMGKILKFVFLLLLVQIANLGWFP